MSHQLFFRHTSKSFSKGGLKSFLSANCQPPNFGMKTSTHFLILISRISGILVYRPFIQDFSRQLLTLCEVWSPLPLSIQGTKRPSSIIVQQLQYGTHNVLTSACILTAMLLLCKARNNKQVKSYIMWKQMETVHTKSEYKKLVSCEDNSFWRVYWMDYKFFAYVKVNIYFC